ncbi:MAG: hypothetical protein M3373_05900 [Gemmatimonadota bacterium]|nr:hypothetical protein [Gemmatimonadota bacterium]
MNGFWFVWLVVTFTIAAAAPATVVYAQDPGAPGARGRSALEQRVRQRFAEVVRDRVGLTDDQMGRLSATNDRYEERRRELVAQERQIRIDMRDEILAGDSANQQRVAQLLDQMIRVQRQRLELVEQEQRDLASFMSPVQRAKYLAVQDQIRRQMDDMRRRRSDGGVAAPRGQGRRAPPDR